MLKNSVKSVSIYLNDVRMDEVDSPVSSVDAIADDDEFEFSYCNDFDLNVLLEPNSGRENRFIFLLTSIANLLKPLINSLFRKFRPGEHLLLLVSILVFVSFLFTIHSFYCKILYVYSKAE